MILTMWYSYSVVTLHHFCDTNALLTSIAESWIWWVQQVGSVGL